MSISPLRLPVSVSVNALAFCLLLPAFVAALPFLPFEFCATGGLEPPIHLFLPPLSLSVCLSPSVVRSRSRARAFTSKRNSPKKRVALLLAALRKPFLFRLWHDIGVDVYGTRPGSNKQKAKKTQTNHPAPLGVLGGKARTQMTSERRGGSGLHETNWLPQTHMGAKDQGKPSRCTSKEGSKEK